MSPVRGQSGRALALCRWIDVQVQLTAQARERDAALRFDGGFRSRARRAVAIDECKAVRGQGFSTFAASIPGFGREREQADVMGF